MNTEWKSPTKIVLGPVAIGASYYRRNDIVDNIWKSLENNCHVLIAAPRRVGKTSVMKDILQDDKDGYSLAFESIQNTTSEKILYKRIYELMLNRLGEQKRFTEILKNWIKAKTIKTIDFKGKIEIEKVEINYLTEIGILAEKLAESNETIVLLIDELPEVLFSIFKDGRIAEAKSILKTLRVWRQESAFKKIKFVFAGSIGIHFVVKQIEGRTSDLNDLSKVAYEPLSKVEAKQYIDWATEGATLQYDNEAKEAILSKINYFVPYFINLLLAELDKQARKNNTITIAKNEIDLAFDLVVKNTDYFNDWFNRLRDYMPITDFNFANEILIHTAHKNFISIQEIYNKAVSHSKTTDYMSLVGDLENDGYIVENNGMYNFISPYLQAYWLKSNPIYNG